VLSIASAPAKTFELQIYTQVDDSVSSPKCGCGMVQTMSHIGKQLTLTWLNALATKTGFHARCQSKLCTRILHWLLSCADLVSSTGVITRKEHSSLILSIHFFLNLHPGRLPAICPWRRMCAVSLRLHSGHVTKICQSRYLKQWSVQTLYVLTVTYKVLQSDDEDPATWLKHTRDESTHTV